MRLIGKLALGAVASCLVAGNVFAADLPPPLPAPPPPPPPPVNERFDGPYWGFFAGTGNWALSAPSPYRSPWIGIQFGYNFVGGNFMGGFEVETEHIFDPPGNPNVDATLNGRAGFILGPVLLYGQVGIGTLYLYNPRWAVGGGAEIALGTHVTLFGEFKAYFLLCCGGGLNGWRVVGGVNYYAEADNAGPGGGFDRGGLYFGASGGFITPTLGPFGHVGVQVGYNFGNGPFFFGPEIETSHSFGSLGYINAAANVRAGVELGPVFLYGEFGIGSLINAIPVWTAGGGAELALGARLGLFAEAKALFALGGGGFTGTQINGGINIHFGR